MGEDVSERELAHLTQVPRKLLNTRELWNEAWEAYLKVVKEEGYEDPRRLPPPAFLRTRCDI